ncbi:MAG: fibronectin type III domain-containing protein [Candidatus Cloacimonetes bacterium]|nr:fibronectin type III domain-containing protein [Candidatus Cloacimonadota bacterium]
MGKAIKTVATIGLAFVTGGWSAAVLAGGSIYIQRKQQKKMLAQQSALFSQSQIQGMTGMIKDSASPKKLYFGKNIKFSGNVVYANQDPNDNKFLILVIALAPHSLGDLKCVYLNDDKLIYDHDTSNENGYTWQVFKNTDPDGINYGSTAQFRYHNEGMEVDHALNFEHSATWTQDHRLKGASYLIAKLYFDQNIYTAIPNISVVTDGMLFDTTLNNTVERSQNFADVIYWYLTNKEFGFGEDLDLINMSSFIDAWHKCNHTMTTGEKRYSITGLLNTGESPKDNMLMLLECCNGRLVFDGEWRLLIGYQQPIIEITKGDFLGPIQHQPKGSEADIFNSIQGVYIGENGNPDEFPQVSVQEYIDQDGGKKLWTQLDLPLIDNKNTAYRIATIHLERARNQYVISGSINSKIDDIKCGDTVFYSDERLGFTNKTFEVIDLIRDNKNNTISGEVVLKSTKESDFDDVLTPVNNAIPYLQLADPRKIDPPSNLVVVEELIRIADTFDNRIKLSWVEPQVGFVSNYEVKYKKLDGSEINIGVLANVLNTEFFLSDTGDYEFFVRAISQANTRSLWLSVTKEIFGKKLPPQDVSNVLVDFQETSIRVSWDPCPDLDYLQTRLKFPFTREIAGTYFDITNLEFWYFIPGIYSLGLVHVDTSNNVSQNENTIQIEIVKPNSPSLKSQVFNNQVEVFWETPISTSFPVRSYKIYKRVWITPYLNQLTFIKEVSSNYVLITELESGLYDYAVVSIDSVGNSSNVSNLSVDVGDPVGFDFISSYEDHFENVAGYENLQDIDGGLSPNINTTESMNDWINRLITSESDAISDLVASGGEYFGQPFISTSRYTTKVFDLGGPVNSAKFKFELFQTLIDQENQYIWTIKTSTDGTNWNVFENQNQAFGLNIRYVQAVIDFIPTVDGYSFLDKVKLSVFAETQDDNGALLVSKDDVLGTEIFFNKNFTDVSYVNAVSYNNGFSLIVNFSDTAYPTSFFVKLRDQNGLRVNGYINWVARGK